MPPYLGCIADDFTGASDLALMLSRGGLRVVQTIGIPESSNECIDADAIVVSLKTRTAPVTDAIRESRSALSWLRGAGAQRFFFKYCSTFDSTPSGNIGPVADALSADLAAGTVVVCPAFPVNGRTIFMGHLFVGGRLLSESPMRDHPLTPMLDSDLVRLMGAQTRQRVGLVDITTVSRGAGATRASLDRLRNSGVGYAVADAIFDENLLALGRAVADDILITGGSGIALGLPAAYIEGGHVTKHLQQGIDLPASGPVAAVSGSCSAATLEQISVAARHWPTFQIDPLLLGDGSICIDAAIEWASPHVGRTPFVIYASALPEQVMKVQAKLGRLDAGDLIERSLAEVSARLVARGISRLIVAGGETSGAVVRRLGVQRMQVGAEICPGVPWMSVTGQRTLHLALKSGNFGGADFFLRAASMAE
jgi:uncharacterized protein YgbK (DUF1537 family)